MADPRRDRLEGSLMTELLRDRHEDAFSGVVPALYQTSLFTFESFSEMRESLLGNGKRFVYTRGRNPTVQEFEEKVARLEGAEQACAFSSGMAAIAAAILGNVRTGQRILCVRNVYPDAYKLMTRLLPRLGIETEFVDGSDTEAVIECLGGGEPSSRASPALLYLENPTSQLFELQDIAVLTAAARERGVVSVVDNSWATPLGQRPLEHGADLVIHSASKYLSGHSDVVAGVVAGANAVIERLRDLELMVLGGKLSPFDAWLLLRGIRTLPLRIERHASSAARVAAFLETHPKVRRVHYPGSDSHPQADLFDRYFEGASGLLSFELATAAAGAPNRASGLSTDHAIGSASDPVIGPATDPAIDRAVELFVDSLRLFRLGVSWGGYESLVYPSLLSHLTAGEQGSISAFEVPRNLIRLHVGLEDADDLLADLARAFAAIEDGLRNRRP